MPKLRCSYQLHIQLCETKPAVWRRIVVSDSTNLAQLHGIVQAVLGWQQRQPYVFEIAGQRYGIPDADWPEDPTMDARRYTLGQLLQSQALPIRYHYDFSRGWQHRIKLESATPLPTPDLLQSLPICLGGRNACPPENYDCALGFADAVTAILDASHPQHAQAVRSLGADFAAKDFDLQLAQSRLRALYPNGSVAAKRTSATSAATVPSRSTQLA